MPLMSVFNIGWMSSLAKDVILQTFFSDNYTLEDVSGMYLMEDGFQYVRETNTTSSGALLKSDGGKLILS